MKLLLPNDIVHKMRCHMLKAGSREIGGMLMGEEVGEQVFRIVDFTIDAKSGDVANFVRDDENHDKVLAKFFKRTGADYERFNYLGEWHTHPRFNVHPSVQDIQTMQDLVDGSGGVSFAVLLIARLRWIVSYECSAHLFVHNYAPSKVNVVRETRPSNARQRARKSRPAGEYICSNRNPAAPRARSPIGGNSFNGLKKNFEYFRSMEVALKAFYLPQCWLNASGVS